MTEIPKENGKKTAAFFIQRKNAAVFSLARQAPGEAPDSAQFFPFAAAFVYSFSGALPHRSCANEAVESFSDAFGAENGDASQIEVSLQGAIREDRDAAIRSPFSRIQLLFIHSALRCCAGAVPPKAAGSPQTLPARKAGTHRK